MAKVSVIVPVYNAEKYLEKCIGSLLAQTLEDVEIVAVDDGSTDRSGAMLDEYAAADARVKVLHKKNGGQATARNLALKYCTGKYVGFLDADDWVKPEKYKRLYDKAEAENLDYVGGGYTDVTVKDGKEIVLCPYRGQKACATARGMYCDALVSPFIHFYSRAVLTESGAYFPEGVIYEDTAFFVMILPYLHKIGFLEEPLSFRLRHANSIMTLTDARKVAQIFEVVEHIRRFYADRGLMKDYGREMEYFCVRILLCSSIERVGTVEPFAERRRLIKQTMQILERDFPQYKANPCFSKGKRDWYVKHANTALVTLVCEAMHCRGKKEYT